MKRTENVPIRPPETPSVSNFPIITRLFIAALLSILILSVGVPAAEGGAATGAVGTDERGVAGPGSGVDATVTRDGETVRYELAFSPGSDLDNVWVVVSGASIVESEGFERVGTGGRTQLRWTGNERARLVLAVRAPWEGAADGPASGRESVATEAWTFASVPFVEIQRVSDGEIERSWPLTERGGALADADGVFGDRYALVGSADVVSRSVAGQRVDVVVPAGTTPGEDPAAVADALVEADWRLDVGARDGAVLAYAAPGVRRGGESVPARDEFWVRADSRLDDPENVWLHEYVHTRQSFRLATEMRWFREASAEYYAARLSYEGGYVDRAAFREHLAGGPSRATLTDPDTWADRPVPHDKGGRVLAVLDGKIRTETDGHRSLQDVFRRLNRHDGAVTYADFVRAVNGVAGTPMDAWLDRHVDGAEPVADQYHDGQTPGRNFGGVTEPSPARTFLLVSAGLSFVAAAPLYRHLRRRERRPGNGSSNRAPRAG